MQKATREDLSLHFKKAMSDAVLANEMVDIRSFDFEVSEVAGEITDGMAKVDGYVEELENAVVWVEREPDSLAALRAERDTLRRMTSVGAELNVLSCTLYVTCRELFYLNLERNTEIRAVWDRDKKRSLEPEDLKRVEDAKKECEEANRKLLALAKELGVRTEDL